MDQLFKMLDAISKQLCHYLKKVTVTALSKLRMAGGLLEKPKPVLLMPTVSVFISNLEQGRLSFATLRIENLFDDHLAMESIAV